MDWDLLHERFVAATRPEPSPFGEDAIEWDYSRVSRALGLTGDEALADRPWDGLAVVSVRASRWEEAAARYGEWAREVGWRLARVSAAPLADVPDPLPLAIAREIVPDGLFLAGALRARLPVTGRRPRSPGASTPFRPGERWMIGLDRVRRRCRVEAASGGLVLFVEAAHHVSPASLNALVYLLNVHRGWRGRMLSAPGKCYVVMAVPPEQEPVLTERLERFGIDNGYAFAEETGGAGAAAAPAAQLDVESEHLLAALADAPMALTAADVGALFGRSALLGLDGLVERGLVVVERRGPSPAFRAAPNAAAGLPEPPPRVRRAIIERYRERARRGHEHVLLGAALLALRMGDLRRAIVLLGRSSHGDAPALSSQLFGELVAGLEAAVERMRASDVAALFALYAQQRRYDRCLQLARVITERPFRSETDLLRTLVHVLCVGRAHLDHALPDGFWSDLKPGRLDPSVLDAAAILGELFARLRWMSIRDARHRHMAAHATLAQLAEIGWFDTATHGRHQYDLRSLFAQMESSVECGLRMQYFDACNPVGHRAIALKSAPTPGHVRTGLVLNEARVPFRRGDSLYRREDFSRVIEYAATTGNSAGSPALAYIWLQRLAARDLPLLGRQLSDDLLMASARGVDGFSPSLVGSALISVVGRRNVASMSARFHFGRATDSQQFPAHQSLRPRSLTWHLVKAGDFAGARAALRGFTTDPAESPLQVLMQFHFRAIVVRCTLAWDELGDLDRGAHVSREFVPDRAASYVKRALTGAHAVCAGEFGEASRNFRAAAEALASNVGGEGEFLASWAHRESWLAGRLEEILKGSGARAVGLRWVDVWNEVLSAVSRSFSDLPDVDRRGALLLRLDYLVAAAERMAKAGALTVSDDALLMIRQLHELADDPLRSVSTDLCERIALIAPAFFRFCYETVRGSIGHILPVAPNPRDVSIALGTTHTLAPPDAGGRGHHERGSGGEADMIGEIGRSACRDARAWRRKTASEGVLLAALRAAVPAATSNLTEHAVVLRMYGVPDRGVARASLYGAEVNLSKRGMVWRARVTIEPGGSALGTRRQGSAVFAGRKSTGGAGAQGDSGGRGDTAARLDAVIVGSSLAAQELRRFVVAAARCEYPVLLVGETGVGKELVARCIHGASRRGRSEMVVADLSSVPESLVEAELFGHVRGAFTGAIADREGCIAAADGGSLFLDEVDSVSPRVQAVLLRVLETGEYRPVGSAVQRVSDFRLIAAALPRLRVALLEGTFRADLHYRISTLQFVIPPLRDRGKDACEIACAYAESKGLTLASSALRSIEGYTWPGNIRQLQNCIDAAAVMVNGMEVTAEAMAAAISVYEDERPLGRCGRDQRARSESDRRWGSVLAAFSDGVEFTAWEFASRTGMSRRSAQRYLADLFRSGRVARMGAGKNTRYRVKACSAG